MLYQYCISTVSYHTRFREKSCGRTLEGCDCLEGCNCELIRLSNVSACINSELCELKPLQHWYHKTLIRLSMHVPALTVSAPAESAGLLIHCWYMRWYNVSTQSLPTCMSSIMIQPYTCWYIVDTCLIHHRWYVLSKPLSDTHLKPVLIHSWYVSDNKKTQIR